MSNPTKLHCIAKVCVMCVCAAFTFSALLLTGCGESKSNAQPVGEKQSIGFTVQGDGYNANTATKAIACVKQVQNNENSQQSENSENTQYVLFNLNDEVQVDVEEAGAYEVAFVSPINADGSIYEMPNTQTLEANTTGAISYEGRATLIDASEVEAERLQNVVDTINAIYNKVDDKNVRKELKSMLSLMEKNVEASPSADDIDTENTGSTDAAERLESGNNVGGSAGYASNQDGNSYGSSASAASESGYSGSGADSSGSGSYSGGSESGSGSYVEPDPTPDVHVHNWYYGSETTITGTVWVCDKCGARLSDTSGHVCSGQGCTFHQETLYNEVPIRVCLSCGAKEYC